MKKRNFLKSMSLMSLGLPLSFTGLESLMADYGHIPVEKLASDETFWQEIRAGYKLKDDYINLENGYYCFIPQETLEGFIDHVREVNYQGSWHMRTSRVKNIKKSAAALAELAGCTPEELVITRNATESLDLVIAGLDWKKGDEAVMAEQDYGSMLNQFKLMEKRYGIKNKLVSVPNHPKNDQEIVDLYASVITKKTKLLMVCHMINISGQILPIRKICDMAHSKGVQVLVDGAHAFGHFDFNINDLDCDYYGTSLHKWLSVPLGAGFLYVKQGKASNLWPLLAETGSERNDDIYRLNHIGTNPVHTDLAIINAINYQNKLGIKRKEARLRYLENYWASQVRDLPGVVVNTPIEMEKHGGIGNVGIESMVPTDMAKRLLDEYKIWTVGINMESVRGCRISPNVYTTTEELDALVSAIKEMSGN